MGNGKNNVCEQPSLDELPRKGSKRYCELVTKIKGGEPFTRKTVVGGRPYWQLCRYDYVGDKRKLIIIKHLGNRKPRKRVLAGGRQ